ncbi:MAG: CRISPR-associated protein Cas4 [Nitrososphaerota archaeon]|nr:CRISPR-associated protein Cas4 [Nitrososphaerota archaeon]
MSEEEPELIPVTDIKQYHFCPRIIYFMRVFCTKERTTESEELGKKAHGDFHKKEKRRTTLLGCKTIRVEQKWTALRLKSEKLGLEGIVDMVVKTPEGYSVIEYKMTNMPNKIMPSHLYQVAAYAMLVEEAFKTIVRKLYIYYEKDKKFLEIPMTENIRRHVIWTVGRIRSIIEKEKLPSVKPSRKCKSCGYKWICKEA